MADAPKSTRNLKVKLVRNLRKVTLSVKFNSNDVSVIKLTSKQVKGFKKGTYKFTVTYKGAVRKNIKMKVK